MKNIGFKIIVLSLLLSMLTGSMQIAYAERDDDYADKARVYLTMSEIIKGYGGDFGLDDYITREQIATILNRANTKRSKKADLSFSDNYKISDWAYEAVRYGVGDGYISGYPDGTFRPQDYVTVSEAVKMTISALAQINDLSYPDGYLDFAWNNDMFRGVYSGNNENITRGEAVSLVYTGCRQYIFIDLNKSIK